MLRVLAKRYNFRYVIPRCPCNPMAEIEDLKSFQCQFESDHGHQTLGSAYFFFRPAKSCNNSV